MELNTDNRLGEEMVHFRWKLMTGAAAVSLICVEERGVADLLKTRSGKFRERNAVKCNERPVLSRVQIKKKNLLECGRQRRRWCRRRVLVFARAQRYAREKEGR